MYYKLDVHVDPNFNYVLLNDNLLCVDDMMLFTRNKR